MLTIEKHVKPHNSHCPIVFVIVITNKPIHRLSFSVDVNESTLAY